MKTIATIGYPNKFTKLWTVYSADSQCTDTESPQFKTRKEAITFIDKQGYQLLKTNDFIAEVQKRLRQK